MPDPEQETALHRPGQAFTKPIALAQLSLATKRASMTLRVFVAGPYIDKAWDEEALAKALPSARLRLEVLKKIESLEHDVILGEHRGVAEMAQDNLPSKASVMLAELELARDACDAIIIIPDSPGSFCELGSWAMLDDICRKMLILGNGQHSNAVSYVGLGVFKSAVDEGAQLSWVDYTDVEGALAPAIAFINKIHDTALARRIKAARV